MTTIKERPILFSGAMVRALLAGTKTQTRRAINKQLIDGEWLGLVKDGPINAIGKHLFRAGNEAQGILDEFVRCPYGQPGDRLWVRENFQAFVPGTWAMVIKLDQNCVTAFQATETERAAEFNDKPWGGPWRPSIHMPRRLSRLLLEIVAVRVERVQDISEADAVAEGIEVTSKGEYINRYKHYTEGGGGLDAQHSYQSLWASINGPESWAANPWVWVVEFKVIEGGKEANRA